MEIWPTSACSSLIQQPRVSGRLAGDVGGCDEEECFLMLDMNIFGMMTMPK